MKPALFIITFLLPLTACQSQVSETSHQEPEVQAPTPDLVLGAEKLDAYLPLIRDKSLALVVNHTSMVGSTHLVDTLKSLGMNISKVFAPEHGFRGAQEAGETVQNSIDQKTGLPIVSLYGSNKKPSVEQLEDVDLVLFDIQDVGVRFYTYISTMSYVMEACAENQKSVLVL
ncbi:MAG: DUF1343 domain-containing protein, partial [Cyclobacteriaceae bacterium]|nr:DUF1343 domain-containing protein [Cyclobacteriaceae bacterium]